MIASTCRWCGKAATGYVEAAGLAAPISDCGSAPCWEESYKIVKGMLPRTWKLINSKGRRKQAPQPGPDLFDLLPKERDTA
jgi:hypothetical protein